MTHGILGFAAPSSTVMTAAVAAFFLLTLPWLNPFTPGPMAQVGPLLFAWACAAGVLLLWAGDHLHGQSQRMVQALALAWVAAAVANAVIGLLQYAGATQALGVWVNHAEFGQAYGNLRQRNQFATLLGLGWVAALWWAPHWPRLAVAATVVLAAGNAASSSRTGLVQWLLIALLVVWWQRGQHGPARQRLLGVVAVGLLVYVLALLALPWAAGLDPLGTGAWARLRAGDAACSSRLTLWRNVLELIALKPWAGWGWGELDYAHFITLYPGGRFCDILDNAHNLPLHLAVELGTPVAALASAGVVWLIWRLRPWAERQPTRQMAWGVLALIGLHSLLEYPLWYGPFQMAAALSLWLLAWTPRDAQRPQNKASFWLPSLYIYASTALVIIALVGFAVWNYHLMSQLYLPQAQRLPAYRERSLEKLAELPLYQDAVRFARLNLTPLMPDNATEQHALAREMLHFSPEPRVVERLLDSARLLGRAQEVQELAARYQAAFPAEHARWLAQTAALPPQPGLR